MRRKVAIIYGSGASHGSGFDLNFRDDAGAELVRLPPPMDRGFFDHSGVRAVYEQGKFLALKEFRDLYLRGYKNLGLEQVWTTIDINSKQSVLGTYDWYEENKRYITKYLAGESKPYPFSDAVATPQFSMDKGQFVLTDVPVYNEYKLLGDCGRDLRTLVVRTLGEIANPDFTDSKYAKLHEIVRGLGIPPAYITFNYDLLLEAALKNLGRVARYLGVNETYDLVSPEKLWPHSALVLKLHGSLGWVHEARCQDITFTEQPIIPSYPTNSASASYYKQPAIVPPTFMKSEINDDARAGDPLTRALIAQWRTAMRVLEDSDRIIVVGYSFPLGDFHTQRLFQIGKMRRRG